MSMVIADSEMVVQRVSLGETWCHIFCLVFGAQLAMHVCLPFPNIDNSCQKDIKLIPNCTFGKVFVICAKYNLSRVSRTVGPIYLIHLNLVCSLEFSVVLCMISWYS